jgi:hypothetical protein
VSVALSEAEFQWRGFLESLVKRGLWREVDGFRFAERPP